MSLGLYITRRLIALVPTLLFVSVLIFSLQQLLPGDPALALAGEEHDPAAVAAIRAKYHLDRPMVVQYRIWLGNVLRGDFGESLRSRIPVSELLASKLPVTIELAMCSMLVALLLGLPAGIISATRKGTPLDFTANLVALSGLSVPHFWLGIMLILLFAVRLGWLPASGYAPPWEDPLRNLTTLLLPSIVLGTGVAGVMMRHTRSAMMQTLDADYVRTARAKSVPERLVVLKHALRNALIPIITLGAIEFGRLLSGAVLTEQIFNIPGFGKLLVDGVFNRDYAVVQAVVLVSAALYVLLNLLADVLYFVVNPRMRGGA
jgi:peptide/nickel transport system permease protein